ncbi:MAG: hypothetical protein EXR72_07520 [Myxococcales bacterium]|nr:hypothetical protein [Myxococcales bacterium]
MRNTCLVIVVLPLVALFLLACSNAPTQSPCPQCSAGTSCDPVQGACVLDPVDAATAADAGAGGCSPACVGLTPHCSATNHCVGCTEDAHCPMGSFCKVGGDAIANCTPGCVDDQRCPNGSKCCNKLCASVAADPQNCGACGNVCKGVHAQAMCAAGKCALAGKCDSGWGDCNANPADGCETNLHVDPNNCVMCGTKCAVPGAISACADGCYATACTWGFDDCNNDPMDGCEVPVLMDGKNCGGCGKSCMNLPNASAGCMNGACTLGSCKMGYFDCNGDAKDGCESNLLADSKNCSKCGNVCPNNAPSCANGACGTLFTFVGVQQNLAINNLGGWSQCYIDQYANAATPIATILQKCTGSYLMLACRPTNAATLTIAAMAPRADVIFDTTNAGNTPHNANGVGWYFGTARSWGFAKEGDALALNSCDTNNTNPELRLCWHTGGANINGGYRCGNTSGLNGSNAWDRIIYQSM